MWKKIFLHAKPIAKQYGSLLMFTPLLLGPACLPVMPKKYAIQLVRIWTRVMTNAIGLTVNVQQVSNPSSTSIDNKELDNYNKRGTLYVHLNQQTHLASLLYTHGIDERFSLITNIEFTLLPFIGWLQHRFGSISIFRQHPESAKRSLEKAIERLRNGDSIGMSIEGKRTTNGKLNTFKKGAAVIAIASQCDIVPFMTHGEYLLWPRGRCTVAENGKIDIKIYPRISTQGLTYADRNELTSRLRVLAETEIRKWEIENSSYIADILSRRDKNIFDGTLLSLKHHLLESKDVITVKMAYDISLKCFSDSRVDEAEESARYLVCHAASLGYRLSDFISQENMIMSSESLHILYSLCQKRVLRMPIQYIVGNWDFFGHTFQLRPPVLIPRPETEELVQLVLDDIYNYKANKSSLFSRNLDSAPAFALRLLDVGCGSGVIGLSLLSELQQRFNSIECTGIDINPEAVSLSKENARNIEVHETSYVCMLKSFRELCSDQKNWGKYDYIVSNPPYIPTSEMGSLATEIINYESDVALNGGSDGLDTIRDILLLSPRLLRTGGSMKVWLEVGEGQPDIILNSVLNSVNEAISEQYHLRYKKEDCQSFNDISGRPRFVCLSAESI